ncbi:MAG: hypothetical protein M3O25_08185 [Actinomycetota bacterium]|nr:hypothetical protein [Actinomycetota bacterium]
MNRRFKGIVAVASVVVLGLSLFAVSSSAGKKAQRLGTSTQVETSAKGNKRSLTVTGELQSPLPRCERQRSVLLYEAGPTGEIAGGAIGHGVSQGGASRGQFTITGDATKKITPTRRFILEAVGRTVKVKGKEVICKRGVSVSFLADFG